MLLLLAVLIFQSCEDTETNSPALQANINATFFKAYSASAIADNTDQMITITGTSDHEEFTLNTKWNGAGTYQITHSSANYATFKNADGIVYTTKTLGSTGAIKLTIEDKERQRLTGTFDFNFITPYDTISVHKGIFYDVSYQILDVVPD